MSHLTNHKSTEQIPHLCISCGKVDCPHHSPECHGVKYESPSYNRNTSPIEPPPLCSLDSLLETETGKAMAELLTTHQGPIFASVAPAIIGQFGDQVSMGQLRTAFKMLGFDDLIEVALFADILTIKEAFEFIHFVQDERDFFLTSCCCPLWFNLVRKNYPDAFKKISPSVSPMIASGRILKHLYPDGKVVFFSPCIAKKSEAQEPELKGAVDLVVNFRELKDILAQLNIDLSTLPADNKDQASLGGRLYARSGGVSFSVKTIVNRLEPVRLIALKAKKVSSIVNCRDVLQQLTSGEPVEYNFIEGMGCAGGCVGGPRNNVPMEEGKDRVNDFGEDSLIMTPFDNLNVMKLLKHFNINHIEEFMENNVLMDLLTRKLPD